MRPCHNSKVLWNRAAPWPERLAVIRRELAALRPDVVALQEAVRVEDYDVDQAREVVATTGLHVVQGQTPGGPYLFGNALASRFPLRDLTVLPLPREGTDENRCLVLARADPPWGPRPLATTTSSP